MNLHQILAAIQAGSSALALEKNDNFFTYTIYGFDGQPYITRTLLPRADGSRVILHRIHREDFDEHPHNHPWKRATFTVLAGGYDEERLVNLDYPKGAMVKRTLRPGDVNQLDDKTFHRISRVEPGTWTLGVLGERAQSWGFLVDGELVDWIDYFQRKGHRVQVQGIS